MKKVESEEENDLRPEYDFSQLRGGVRGKYVARYREGTNLVLLDPDVAAAFRCSSRERRAPVIASGKTIAALILTENIYVNL